MFAGTVLARHVHPGVAASRMPGTAEGRNTDDARGQTGSLRRSGTRAAGHEKGRDSQRNTIARCFAVRRCGVGSTRELRRWWVP
jgi:hypothetical protein